MVARGAGLLLHPTSLPGPLGIGDLGPGASRFLDWAAEAGQTLWQFLPLGPTDTGGSPYTSLSSFAGNPLLVSPERLVQAGWVPRAELDGSRPASGSSVDFEVAAPQKRRWLARAWRHFTRRADAAARRRFEAFAADPDQASWLENWAVYAAVRERGTALADEVAEQRWLQFVFFEQWQALRAEARARDIRLLGDLPFYVAGDGADVGARPELFRLDGEGRPTHVAGVPPDYFSAEGQLWGNPLYRWDALAQSGYAFWIDRARAALRTADLLRLDHFRGFAAYWEVEAGASSAATGRWVPGPGRALFEACRAALGALPFVAEDLGVITEDVHALRRELGLYGMRVLQFAFAEGDDGVHGLANLATDLVAYTGTHDNDTFAGWFESLDPAARERVTTALGGPEREVTRRAIELLYASPAALVVVPMQDVLELGSAARMNRPGSIAGNWRWRAEPGAFSLHDAARLRRLAESTGRR